MATERPDEFIIRIQVQDPRRGAEDAEKSRLNHDGTKSTKEEPILLHAVLVVVIQ
jgi:hypothetical protein